MYWGAMVPVKPVKRFRGIAALVQAHAYETQLKEVGKVMSEAFRCNFCGKHHDGRAPFNIEEQGSNVWERTGLCDACHTRLEHMNDYDEYGYCDPARRIKVMTREEYNDGRGFRGFMAGAIVGSVLMAFASTVVTFL